MCVYLCLCLMHEQAAVVRLFMLHVLFVNSY